jgi:hypothetical protein
MRKYVMFGLVLGTAAAAIGFNNSATAGNKTDVCHNGNNVISVSNNAVNAHLAHGDNVVSAEACNGADDDCDGDIDEGVLTTWYLDADGDGLGDASDSVDDCTAPSGYVDNADDSDDDDECSDIQPDGASPSDKTIGIEDDAFNTFFSETCDEYAEDEEEGAESADVEGEEDVEEY